MIVGKRIHFQNKYGNDWPIESGLVIYEYLCAGDTYLIVLSEDDKQKTVPASWIKTICEQA
jgi:hypothetical protein